jgi:hypothetical protein
MLASGGGAPRRRRARHTERLTLRPRGGRRRSLHVHVCPPRPCVFEAESVERREQIDAARCDADLHHRPRPLYISFSDIKQRCPEPRKRTHDTGCVLIGHPDPEVESTVARGIPWTATAYAPTSRYSAPSSDNADNMSRKSGFSTQPSRERPRVKRELPHRRETLRGRRNGLTTVVPDGRAWTNANADRTSPHASRIVSGSGATTATTSPPRASAAAHAAATRGSSAPCRRRGTP